MGEKQTWLDAEVEKVLEQKNALAVLEKVRHAHKSDLKQQTQLLWSNHSLCGRSLLREKR